MMRDACWVLRCVALRCYSYCIVIEHDVSDDVFVKCSYLYD